MHRPKGNFFVAALNENDSQALLFLHSDRRHNEPMINLRLVA